MPHILQKRNNLKRASLFIFVIIFLAVTAPAAYSSGIYRFPLFWSPDTFDPTLDSSNSVAYIVQQVGDGLVAYDRNLRVVPGLAKSWKVSRDGREYLFTLRKGVRFHNGKTLTADDVVASFLRVFRSGKLPTTGKFLGRIDGAGELLAGRADTLAGLETVSDNRVRIRLTEPYAPFLSSLAMPLAKIMPAELARNAEDKYGKHPVGTGPFIFHSWSDNVIVLGANRDYFKGPTVIDEVHFVMYDKGDRDKAMEDFLSGKLEGTLLPGSADPDELRKKGYQVIIRPRLSIMFYGMNVNVPPYDSPDLRMALALATDRKTNVGIELGGLYPPAHQILPLGMPGYTPENALIRYDPDEASRLLKKAGYPGGKGLGELSLASASHSDFAVKELDLFSQDLERIGVKVKPVFVDDWGEFKNGIKEGKHPFFRYALYADAPTPDDLMAPLFETGSTHNYTNFSDPEADMLFAKARIEVDPAKRASLYRKAEIIILRKTPLVPVLFISTQAVFQKSVQGIDLPATGVPYLRLREISITGLP